MSRVKAASIKLRFLFIWILLIWKLFELARQLNASNRTADRINLFLQPHRALAFVFATCGPVEWNYIDEEGSRRARSDA